MMIEPDDAMGYLGTADLDEILAAVDMPRAGVRQWLAGLQKFCEEHGGARYYGRLRALLDACQDRLDALESRDSEENRRSNWRVRR